MDTMRLELLEVYFLVSVGTLSFIILGSLAIEWIKGLFECQN